MSFAADDCNGKELVGGGRSAGNRRTSVRPAEPHLPEIQAARARYDPQEPEWATDDG